MACMPIFQRTAVALGALLLVSACHRQDTQPGGNSEAVAVAASTASLQPPPACTAALKSQPPVLRLPRTDAPKSGDKGKGKDATNVDIAQIHTVNRPLQEIGIWNDAGDGWSVLTLQLGSDKARTLAVRLHDVHLPKNGALWLCSVDGKRSEGPYADAPNGELWTSAVAGSQARVEVWAPTRQRDDFRALLADVYGSYR
jgi:hypothetical protein